jgi:hypothetical protein
MTILITLSMYSSSFNFDVSNAVPESSEIDCRESGSSTVCCQEKWDGEIIGSWIKTCTACNSEGDCNTTSCNAEGHCSSSNSNTLGPASTPPKSTAPEDNDAIDNLGILDEQPRFNPKNNDAVSPNNDNDVSEQTPPSSSLPSSSESTDEEQTTSFAKKGSNQMSPTPPECPKQGPIPPDCTLKPKF